MLLCYLLYFNRKGYLLYMLSYVLFMLELRTAVHAVLSTVHAALRLCYNTIVHAVLLHVALHGFGRTLLQRGHTDRVLSHRWIQSR